MCEGFEMLSSLIVLSDSICGIFFDNVFLLACSKIKNCN